MMGIMRCQETIYSTLEKSDTETNMTKALYQMCSMQYNLVKATIDHLHACQNLIAGNGRLCLLVCASF